MMPWTAVCRGTCPARKLGKRINSWCRWRLMLRLMTPSGTLRAANPGGGVGQFVIVGHRSGASRLHRLVRLGAVERLDLALLIDRQDDRVGGRIDVEADMSLALLRKLFDGLWRELMGVKNALHRLRGLSPRSRQHPAGPLGRFSRRQAEFLVDNTLHGAGRQRWLAGLVRFVAR